MGPFKDNYYRNRLSGGLLGHSVGLLAVVELPVPLCVLTTLEVDIKSQPGCRERRSLQHTKV